MTCISCASVFLCFAPPRLFSVCLAVFRLFGRSRSPAAVSEHDHSMLLRLHTHTPTCSHTHNTTQPRGAAEVSLTVAPPPLSQPNGSSSQPWRDYHHQEYHDDDEHQPSSSPPSSTPLSSSSLSSSSCLSLPRPSPSKSPRGRPSALWPWPRKAMIS